jgi:hypothetical protein
MTTRFLFCWAAAAAVLHGVPLRAADVPLGGNSFVTTGEGGRRRGADAWSQPDRVVSVFFRVDRAADLELALKGSVPDGESRIRATAEGQTFTLALKGSGLFPLGPLRVEKAGYVRVDLQGVEKSGTVFAELSDLVVTTKTEGAQFSYVKDNEGNRFYWGRRGPSVHLGYRIPEGITAEWFYNELTVPEGMDPVGSYYMANGFGEGYFGMQVNSPAERRILFSVWSPFSTDNPKEIPEDQRITMLAKGRDVRAGEFGGEGSGGQSFLVFPWKTGGTYRFLNRAKPDGSGHTVYTGWFQEAGSVEWRLIASFRRPKTDKHLTGLHSFLEGFSDGNGWRGREGRYANQWMRDTAGQWHELRDARFTGDDIAQRGYRMDRAGGVNEGVFFLRNGGFFENPVPLNSRFTRPASGQPAPVIDFAKLEGVAAGFEPAPAR